MTFDGDFAYVNIYLRLIRLAHESGLEFQVLNCAVAEAVYEDAAERFKNPRVHAEFAAVANRFPIANELTQKIIRYTL